MFGFFKQRGAETNSQPFPESWRQILEKRLPLFNRLPEADKRELESHIQTFLAKKQFEGCAGLELDDDIRVSIAGQACMLLLHRKCDGYPALKSILVYPSSYFAKKAEQSESGIVTETHTHRLGESWEQGAVVLAWDSVKGGASNVTDGQNVVLHEFAHQLDQQDGLADGTPLLQSTGGFTARRNRYLTWAQVLSREYEELRGRARKNQKSVMDHYGATHPAEFFAVATECFFEKPKQMAEKHPELYEELKQFYQQDPISWLTPPGRSLDKV